MIALLAALLLPADTIPAPVHPPAAPEPATRSALLAAKPTLELNRGLVDGAAPEGTRSVVPLPVSRFMPESPPLSGAVGVSLFGPRSPTRPVTLAPKRASSTAVLGIGTESAGGLAVRAVRAEKPGVAAEAPQLVEYSDAYLTRLKIHKYASYTTLPLFAAAYVTGNELITKGPNAASWARSTHGAIAGSLGALFAINTITGVWNLYEGRHDPEGRTRRIIHSVLLLAADAGFLATAALAGESEGGEGGWDYGERGEGDNSAHRALAITSMGLAFTGYMTMSWPFRRD